MPSSSSATALATKLGGSAPAPSTIVPALLEVKRICCGRTVACHCPLARARPSKIILQEIRLSRPRKFSSAALGAMIALFSQNGAMIFRQAQMFFTPAGKL